MQKSNWFVFSISFLFLASHFSVFSQTDTSSSTQINVASKKTGYLVFGGLGTGGNIYKKGFAYGGGILVHYNIHSFSVFTSKATARDELYSKDYTNTLNSASYGLTYGVGVYEKYVSASIGAGIGYSNTDIDFHKNFSQPVYTNYSNFGACVSGQLTVHGKWLGLSAQGFCNLSSLSTYTFLVGLEVVIDNIKTLAVDRKGLPDY